MRESWQVYNTDIYHKPNMDMPLWIRWSQFAQFQVNWACSVTVTKIFLECILGL